MKILLLIFIAVSTLISLFSICYVVVDIKKSKRNKNDIKAKI